MFGYITVNKEKLKIREWNRYHAYYCGLCRSLKESAGQKGRMTLTYDMTFLAILLDSLYDCTRKEGQARCAVHPAKKYAYVQSEASNYAADMNILLCYDNLLDDWQDEKSVGAAAAARALRSAKRRIAKQYPRQAEAVEAYLKKLHETEQEQSPDLDRASGETGEMLAEVCVWREDEWQDELRELGFYLGKFIYLMDAYEDMEKDKKKGNYNPFLLVQGTEDTEELAKRVLTMMAAKTAEAFERLPIVDNAELLRNILYAGIWGKFEAVHIKRSKK
ncbi:MAG: DUF5685 family protein [Lachnospiraceae bacterium]